MGGHDLPNVYPSLETPSQIGFQARGVFVFLKYFKKKLIFLFFYFKLIFLDYFNILILKIILKNKNNIILIKTIIATLLNIPRITNKSMVNRHGLALLTL
jgi:hypothetical protein